MCLSSSSVAGYQYNKKINTEKEIYKNKMITEKEIYNKNIDEYNQNYNMNYNYNNNKVYYKGDFRNMNQTVATVISDPEIKDIIVNDKKIRLYNYIINYKPINYMGEVGKIRIPFLFDNIPTFNTFSTTKNVDIPFPDTLDVTSNIITTLPLEKNDFISVYYNYGSIDRLGPPYLPEKYVTYLNKK
jgi:hypothetical protein